MLCAASAATARDAFVLSWRARDDRPGAIFIRGGAGERRRSFYPRRKSNVASAAATTGKAENSTSSSSSSQYLDALQSLLREAREDGMPVADDEGDAGTKTAVEEEEAPWSLADSASFLSAALGPPAPSSGKDGNDGGGVSEEEARELLLKTGWRRSRGGGRFQARERSKARMTEEAAAEEEEATTTAAAAMTASATAVPSPSALSATLSALREHAGLTSENGISAPSSSQPSSSLARAVRRCPSLLALSPNQVALAAAFLRSLGLDAADVAVACSREPRLLGFGVAESMAPVATFLRSKRVGMRAEDVARLAVSAPTVLGLSVERSLEPRVAFLERALSSSSSSSVSQPPPNNPLLAKVLRSSPSLLHLSLRSGEDTLAELERRLPDAGVRSRAIAAAPSMLLVGAERLGATLDSLARVASHWLDEEGGGGGADSEEEADSEKQADDGQQRLLVVSDLVRRHPSLLRHAFTGPEAVMLPAADWLARLLSVVEVDAEEATAAAAAAAAAAEEAGAARTREQGSGERRPLSLADLPRSSTPRGRALAAAAIRRCPFLLGRSLSRLEATASWLEERARVFLSSSSAADSENPGGDVAFKETRARKGRSPEAASQTPLSLVAGVARRFPQAFGLASANLDAKLKFLTDEVGMSEGEAAGVAVAKMPQLLGLRLRSLRARAAFLLDGNDDVGEEEGDEEEEEERGEQSGEKGGREARAKNKPVKGRRSASEIAAFAPCLASSLEKLVARHAAASSAQRAPPPKKKKTAKPKKKKKGGDGEEQEAEETAAAAAKKKKRRPSLSSLLACTDSVLEGRLGLPLGSLEVLKADWRVREAIERAERAAAAKEEEE